MTINKKKLINLFIPIFIIGIIVFKFSLITEVSHVDLEAFKKGSALLLSSPWKDYYQLDQAARYLPGIPILLWLIGIIYRSFFNPGFNLNSPLTKELIYLFKDTAAMFDILNALLIFLIINKTLNFKKNLFILILFIINPVVIYVSSVWGQFESIYCFCLLSAVYLLHNKKYSLSIVTYIMAILVKPQAIIILPIIMFYIYYLGKFKKFILGIFLSLIPLSSIIFFSKGNPLIWLINFFGDLTSIGATSTVSSSAFNLWSLLTGFTTYINQNYLFLTYQNWGFIVFGLFYLLIFIKFFKDLKAKNYHLIETIFIIYLGYFILAPQVRERYLYPSILFNFLLISIYSKKIFTLILLSIINLANLTFFFPSFPGLFSLANISPFNLIMNSLKYNNGFYSSVILVVLLIIETISYFHKNESKSLI